MNLRFENQGTSTYLVYEVQPTDELDTMTLGMLANNTIPGFAPVTFQQIDTTKYIRFNVTAKVSVAQFFSGPVNKRRLMGVFYGVINAISAAEDYMLDPEMLLLDLDHMYSDVSTCETVLICLPVMNHNNSLQDLGKFFKSIIFNTQFDQTENCGYVAQILNYLNSTPNLSLHDFKNLLDSINKAGAAQPVPQPAPQPAPQPIPQPIPQPAPQPIPQPAPQPAPQPVPQPVPQPAPQPMPQPQPQQPAQNWQPVIPQGGYAAPQQPQPPKAPVGFAVPGQQPQQPQKPAAPANPDEKPMTLMYLMQHYNKENAAIYKAQQEAKKGQKVEAAPKQPKAPKNGKQSAAPMSAGFAVPGQSAPQVPGGFAIPGQQPQQPKAPAFAQPAAPQQPKAPAYGMPPQQPQQPKAPNFAMPAQQPIPQPAPQPIPQPAQPAMPINFGATTVLGVEDMGGTTVLSAPSAAAPKPSPYLLRRKNNERIPLNKPVFRIGKEKSYVDYFIADNPAISRSHANIINREGDFFIVDTNSTNHTYVNDVMSPSNAETKLAHGDRVTLGNEEFEFKMV